MNAQRYAADAGHMFFEILEQAIEFRGHGVTDGVGYVDRRSASFNRRRHDLGEVCQFRTRCVLGGEFHVSAKFTGLPDRAHRTLDDFFLRHPELVLAMNCAGSDKHVNPVFVRAFDRGMHLFDVFRIAAGKAANNRATVLIGNRFDRFEVAG